MIVGTEKVLAGSGWVPSERTLLLRGRVSNDPDAGWKRWSPQGALGLWWFGLTENLKTISVFPPYRDPGGMLSRPGRMLSRNDKLPDIWNTHGISGNVFTNPTASSSSPYPGGFNPWNSTMSEHTSPHVTSERQNPDTTLDPRCQSGPSARNSFDPEEGRSSKDYGADQQRLQISDPHFDKFTTPATFACLKIRFKIEVCTCSQFPTDAMLWIKEVEMVESVDDLKSLRSIRGTQGPDFEVLDAKIASALNRIIHSTRFKKICLFHFLLFFPFTFLTLQTLLSPSFMIPLF